MTSKIKMLPLFADTAFDSSEKREMSSKIVCCAASAAAGFLLTSVRIGGALSPFAVSLTAAVSPVNGLCALAGAVISAAAGGFVKNITELSAMAVMLIYTCIFRKSRRKQIDCTVSGVIYFLSACAVTAGSERDWVMFFAAVFRGLMCSAMALCFWETVRLHKEPFSHEENALREKDYRRLICGGASCIVILASLCSKSIGIINLGRITAGFSCAAAARKFGAKGGMAAGILSASAFLLSDAYLGRCGAMLAFAALVSGMYQPKGKYAVNIAFICSCFGITAAAGMPTGAPEFIADMCIAAVLYCVVPERLYIPYLNGLCRSFRSELPVSRCRPAFAAQVLKGVENDALEAAQLLYHTKTARKEDKSLSRIVQSRVCGGICAQARCSAVCGSSTEAAREGCFRAAESYTEKKGSITGKELPAGFEGCTKKTQIADEYTHANKLRLFESRNESDMRRFLELAAEQLDAACHMLDSFSYSRDNGLVCDYGLTESAAAMLRECGFDLQSISIGFDESMTLYAEAYIRSQKKITAAVLSEASEKLGELTGRELEIPEILSGDGCTSRVRWWSGKKYIPQCSFYSCPAQGRVCGDSYTDFYDGAGNYYVIIADGMGVGGRAAAQSSMAVNMLRRLVLADTGSEGAIKTLNCLLSAVSADEVFTTVDMLMISCISGEGKLLKMGAAPSVLLERDGEGIADIKMLEGLSLPVGILGKTEISCQSISLDENSRLVMMTDGIDNGCMSCISAIIDNERLTCEQLAEKIMECSDEMDEEQEANEGEFYRRDDKTCAVIRLYRN